MVHQSIFVGGKLVAYDDMANPHDDGNRQVQDVNVVMRVDLLDTVEYRPKSTDINFSEQSF